MLFSFARVQLAQVNMHILLVLIILFPFTVVSNSFDRASERAEFVSNRSDNKSLSDEPYTGIIKIGTQLTDETYGEDNIAKWKKILRWGDFCYEDRVSISVHELGMKKGLLEVTCMNGAYNFYSLYYHIDKSKRLFTAKLLQFEYFRKEDESPRILRHLTFLQYGSVGFDKKRREISNYHKYVGTGQCGWEAIYRIVKGKSVLKSMKAQWNCEAGLRGNDPKWKPLNLNKLRRLVRKTVYDKIED